MRSSSRHLLTIHAILQFLSLKNNEISDFTICLTFHQAEAAEV